MTEARKERRAREQILQTCVALGNNNTSTITCCFIVYSYCVPLFRVQQQRCSSVTIHSKEMHKYLCALHSIGLFRSGSHPHTFTSLLPLITLSLSLCLPPTTTYSSFSCALVGCMIARSFCSISYPSPFRTARAARSAFSQSCWRFFLFLDSQSN